MIAACLTSSWIRFSLAKLSYMMAVTDKGEETIYLLRDAGLWHEMTEAELEREPRGWSTDMKGIEQIKREWREYREG